MRRVMHGDLWSYLYSRKGGAWMWLFPLCWQQQSRWHVLLLGAWCFHGKWDGRWRTQRIGRRRQWCLPQTLCRLGAHSSNGGIRGRSRGGMPFFPLVTRAHFWKAAVVWEGSIWEKESLIFLFVCLDVEVSLRAMRPASSDAKLMGGGLMWPCRPLHFAISKAFCSMWRRSGVSIPLHFLSFDIVNTGYCVSVHFRKHSVIWGGCGTLFLILHEINGCDPVFNALWP